MAVFETFPHFRRWQKTKLIELLFFFSVPLSDEMWCFYNENCLRRDSCCSQSIFPMIPSKEVIKELIDWLLLTKNPRCKKNAQQKPTKNHPNVFVSCTTIPTTLTKSVHVFGIVVWLLYPVWSMGLVYLPTFTYKKSTKYTIHGSLVGDFNSLEKYDRQMGSFSQVSGWKCQKYVKPPTWMSRWKLGSMVRINGLFYLLLNGVFLGVITQLQTIDPNFQRDIQVDPMGSMP